MKWLRTLTKFLPSFVRKHLPFTTAPRHESHNPSGPNEAVMGEEDYFPLLELPAEIRLVIFGCLFEGFTLSLVCQNGTARCVYTPPEVLQRGVFDAEVLKKAIAPNMLAPERTLQPPHMICRVNKLLRREAVSALAKSAKILLCPELPASNPFSNRHGLPSETHPPERVHMIDASTVLNETFTRAIRGVCVSLQSTVIVDYSTLPNLERVSLDGYLDPHSAIGWDRDVEKTDSDDDPPVKYFTDQGHLGGYIFRDSQHRLRTWAKARNAGLSLDDYLAQLSSSSAAAAAAANLAMSEGASSTAGSELLSFPHKRAAGGDSSTDMHFMQSAHPQDCRCSRTQHSGGPDGRQKATTTSWITLSRLHLFHDQLTRRLAYETSHDKALSRLEKRLPLYVESCFTAPSTSSRSSAIHPMWTRKWWLELVWVPRHLEQILKGPQTGRRMLQDVMGVLGLLCLVTVNVDPYDGETKVIAAVGTRRMETEKELQSKRGQMNEVEAKLDGVDIDDGDWVRAVLDALGSGRYPKVDTCNISTQDSGGQMALGLQLRSPSGKRLPDMAVQQAFMLDNEAKNDSYLVATVNLTREELIGGRTGGSSLGPIDVCPTRWLKELEGCSIGTSHSAASSLSQTSQPLPNADTTVQSEDNVDMPTIITTSWWAYHKMLNQFEPTCHNDDGNSDSSRYCRPESSSAVKGKSRSNCPAREPPFTPSSCHLDTPSSHGKLSPFAQTNPFYQGVSPYHGHVDLSSNPNPNPYLKTPLVPPLPHFQLPPTNFPSSPPSSPCPSPVPSSLLSHDPSPSPSPSPAPSTLLPYQTPFTKLHAAYHSEQAYATDLWGKVLALRRQLDERRSCARRERKVVCGVREVVEKSGTARPGELVGAGGGQRAGEQDGAGEQHEAGEVEEMEVEDGVLEDGELKDVECNDGDDDVMEVEDGDSEDSEDDEDDIWGEAYGAMVRKRQREDLEERCQEPPGPPTKAAKRRA